MDDKIINIRKTFLEKSKDSIDEISRIPRKRLLVNNSTSIPNTSANSVDLDIDELKEKNVSFNSSITDIANSKLEYRNKLISNLQNARNKISNEMESLEKKSKYSRHTILIKNDVAKRITNLDNPDISKFKTNYRTICDEIDSKTRDSIITGSKLNTSGFLSLSRQSLNDNLNESGISNIASRISGNLLKRTLSQRKEVLDESDSKSFPQIPSSNIITRQRRYRTVVKKDRISSYLTRISKDDNIFSIQSQTPNRNIALNLNLSNSSEKRIDFSKILRINKDNTFEKIESPNLNSYWNCNNCDSSNPSNFNFCPTCSASNPKLTLMKERNASRLDEHDSKNWICPRCSTKNDEIRVVCIFCFKNKNESSDCKKFFVKRPKLSVDCEENESIEVEKVAPNDQLLNPNIEEEKLSNVKWRCPGCWVESNCDVESCPCCFTKNESYKNVIKPANKWACETCLVENDAEVPACPCCMTQNPPVKPKNNDLKPMFSFGIQNAETTCAKSTIKFGTSDSLANNLLAVGSGNKWACSTCLVENDAGVEACPCCMTANPSAKPNIDDLKPMFSFGIQKSTIKFGTNNSLPNNLPDVGSDNKWVCDTCLVENGAGVDACPCCMTPNPSSKHKTGHVQQKLQYAVQNNSENKFTFGTNTSNKWTCDTCLVESDANVESCPCCMTKNPSAKGKSIDLQSSFKFGPEKVGDKLPKPPTFKFGIGKETNPINPPTFKFGTGKEEISPQKAPTFKFGTEKKIDPINPSAFKFGTGKEEISPQKAPTFKFGPEKKDNNPQSSPTFKFGKEKERSELCKSPSVQTNVNKWSCPGCWVENSGQLESCPCCSTKNPSSKTQTGIIVNEVKEINFNLSTAKWNCPTCMVDNKESDLTCVCCQEKNPNKISDLKPSGLMFNFPKNSSVESEIKFGSSGFSTNVMGVASTPFNFGSMNATNKGINNNSFTKTPLSNDIFATKNDADAHLSGNSKPFHFGTANGNGSNMPGQFDAQLSNKSDKITTNAIFQFGKVVSSTKTSAENGDNELHYHFSQPESLGMSICAEVPVDLVFEFSDPLHHF